MLAPCPPVAAPPLPAPDPALPPIPVPPPTPVPPAPELLPPVPVAPAMPLSPPVPVPPATPPPVPVAKPSPAPARSVGSPASRSSGELSPFHMQPSAIKHAAINTRTGTRDTTITLQVITRRRTRARNWARSLESVGHSPIPQPPIAGRCAPSRYAASSLLVSDDLDIHRSALAHPEATAPPGSLPLSDQPQAPPDYRLHLLRGAPSCRVRAMADMASPVSFLIPEIDAPFGEEARRAIYE